MNWVRLLRPRHWVKNSLIFAALLFARELTHIESVVSAILAFAAFCLLASSMYIVNDLADIESDKKHPVKKNRPLAAGLISVDHARVSALILFVSGMLLAYDRILLVAIAYVSLITLYSHVLKRIVVIDVLVVALGFVLRAIAGAVAIGVVFSPWLLVTTLFLALFLVLGKRRNELELLDTTAKEHRKILDDYSLPLLDQLITITAAASLISYSLYTLNPETVERFGTDKLYMTLPFAVYGLFRYFYLVYKKNLGGDPASTLLTDRSLVISILLWVLSIIGIIYGKVS